MKQTNIIYNAAQLERWSVNENLGRVSLSYGALDRCWYMLKNKTLKVAQNAIKIGEVWNPVCCHGNKTFKLILCCTFGRMLLQKIKYFCYKLTEISVFIKIDQNLVEYMTSSLD